MTGKGLAFGKLSARWAARSLIRAHRARMLPTRLLKRRAHSAPSTRVTLAVKDPR